MTIGCNLSKEIGGRIRNWRGAFWERRYDGIVVSDEPDTQWSRLKYHLSHSVKEQLCESPLDWPGVHCAGALVHGEKLDGFWFNRSKEWAAKRRGQIHASGEARKDFKAEHAAFLAQYWSASEALRSDPMLGAVKDFPLGCYPLALAFVGAPVPPRPPAPRNRRLVVEGTEIVEPGEIPVVEVPVPVDRPTGSARASPRSRGQP